MPTKIPNLLVNGATVLRVYGHQHAYPNLSEVIDGCCAFIDNPENDIEGLMQYILRPTSPQRLYLWPAGRERCIRNMGVAYRDARQG
jgi:DNA gyrase subunit A